MAKITLDDLTHLQPSAITAINANSNAIETAIENTISRDGTSPNEMDANLDMNSNRILNLPDAVNEQEPATLGQLRAAMALGTGILPPPPLEDFIPVNEETVDYRTAITVVGGTLDDDTLAAIDAFISEGKGEGWWSKILDCSLCVGDTLAASLVKLVVAPTTASSYTNFGFIEADYTQAGGIGNLNNTSKYLGTGVIPSEQGMSIDDMAIAVEKIQDGNLGINLAALDHPLLADNPASGDPIIYIDSGNMGSPGSGGTTQFGYGGSTALVVNRVTTNFVKLAMDGLRAVSGNPNASSAPTTEMTIFRQKVTGAFQYGKAKVGATFIFNQQLSDVELKAFCLSLITFNRAVRMQAFTERTLFLGDSITMGIQVTEAQAWATLVSAALNVQGINTGVSAAPLRTPPGYFNTFITQMISKYEDGLDLDITRMILMIGTNDAAFIGNTPPGTFQTDLETICAFYKNAGKDVVLCSMPWTGAAGVGRDFTTWAAQVGAAAAAVPGVKFANVHQAFIDTGTPASYFIEAAPNSFHPNAAGHTLIANTVLAVI